MRARPTRDTGCPENWIEDLSTAHERFCTARHTTIRYRVPLLETQGMGRKIIIPAQLKLEKVNNSSKALPGVPGFQSDTRPLTFVASVHSGAQQGRGLAYILLRSEDVQGWRQENRQWRITFSLLLKTTGMAKPTRASAAEAHNEDGARGEAGGARGYRPRQTGPRISGGGRVPRFGSHVDHIQRKF